MKQYIVKKIYVKLQVLIVNKDMGERKEVEGGKQRKGGRRGGHLKRARDLEKNLMR